MEPRRFHRSLRRNSDASDPQTPDPFSKRDRGDAHKERTKDAPTPVLADRRAVPDVAFAGTWADLELQLTDPFRPYGQPPISRHAPVDDDREASAAPRESQSDEIGFAAHRGFD